MFSQHLVVREYETVTVLQQESQLQLLWCRHLQDALVSGLKLLVHSPDTHETCARLVAENPLTAEKRKNLLAHQNKLILAREVFNALG